jgi:tRNA-intron lyase
MKHIKILAFGNSYFFSNNLLSILSLRNEFRIYGNISTVFKQIYLILSIEEVLIGIEFGFLNLRRIRDKKKITPSFLIAKYIYGKFKNLKTLVYKEKTFFTETKSEINIRLWREAITIISCTLKKKKFKFVKNKIKFLFSKNKTEEIYMNKLITEIKSENLLKYKIFRDLWQRGLIVTCGIKFGATYLIYAGEISIAHASSSVILMEPTHYIYPHEIISFGRVGTTTKKRCLLAKISSDLSIVYTGLKWNNDLP